MGIFELLKNFTRIKYIFVPVLKKNMPSRRTFGDGVNAITKFFNTKSYGEGYKMGDFCLKNI